MWRVWKERDMHTGFGSGNIKERDRLKDISKKWHDNIKTSLN